MIEDIALPTKNGTHFTLGDDLRATYAEAYPGVDIDAQLKKMRAWLISRPHRQKTLRGMPTFVNAWLARSRPSTGIKSTRDTTLAEDLTDRTWAN